MPNRRKPGRPVHCRPEIAPLAQLRLTGVQSQPLRWASMIHPEVDQATRTPDSISERPSASTHPPV
jgi:hypothetical protein